jgi:hypothetical protein
MSDRQKSCADRWWEEKEDTFTTLRALWESYCNGEEEHEEHGSLHDYGLSFVDPEDCEIAPYDCGPWRTTYVFLDWFDGCERELSHDDHKLALSLFGWFQEIGAVEHYDR